MKRITHDFMALCAGGIWGLGDIDIHIFVLLTGSSKGFLLCWRMYIVVGIYVQLGLVSLFIYAQSQTLHRVVLL